MDQRGDVITPKGFVAARAYNEKLIDCTINEFDNTEWRPFERWLCEKHPEMIGVKMTDEEACSKLWELFQEFKKS